MPKPTAKTMFAQALELHPAGATVTTIQEHAAAQGVTCSAATLSKYRAGVGAEKIEIEGEPGYRLAATEAAPAAEPAPCAPAAEAEAAPAPAEPKAPKVRARSRVDVTVEMLRRPEGCTAAELAEAFAAEFDTGLLSTSRQALHKVPKTRGFATVTEKDETRGLVYRAA